MRHWLLRFAATFALAFGLLAPETSYATMVNYYVLATGSGEIEGKPVSAKAVFDVVDGKLQIKLTHTATEAYNNGVSIVLTDINFDFDTPVPGVEFGVAGSSVKVASGSTLYYEAGGGTESEVEFDVSGEWALARNTLLPRPDGSTPAHGPYDYSVTAASFDPMTKFVGPDLGGANGGLNGVDFGLLNQATNPQTDAYSNACLIVDSVLITLAAVTTGTGATHLLTDADLFFIKSPTFSFGSEHVGIPSTYTVIPEPSAVIVWSLLGLTWAGSSWVRRYRRGRRRGRTEKALA